MILIGQIFEWINKYKTDNNLIKKTDFKPKKKSINETLMDFLRSQYKLYFNRFF